MAEAVEWQAVELAKAVEWLKPLNTVAVKFNVQLSTPKAFNVPRSTPPAFNASGIQRPRHSTPPAFNAKGIQHPPHMCRIAGISSPSLQPEALRSMVGEMCRILEHGGPDHQGIWMDETQKLALGHRRLSLIDLSAAGNQPMSYANGRFQISFNGEIYNYKQLKNELQAKGAHFKTHSDTEVILAAFDRWGTAAYERFNGMFAFALWDQQEGKLYLVRDAAGIKPLYYSITKEGIAFASEIRAFKAVPWLQEQNQVWPVYLMAYGHLPEPVTILKKVKPLKKGTFLCYEFPSGKHHFQTFKKYSFLETAGQDRGEAIRLIKDTLHQSVRRHLISDAPIGSFLSGGIDSSIISILANSNGNTTLNTLSLIFEDAEFSEEKYQDIVLEKMNCQSSQHLLKQTEFHACLPRILEDMDQPGCDGINTWFISRFAKEKGLKAVLSGIGSDELLGGYPSFERMQKVNMLENLPTQLLKTGKYTGLKRLRRLGYLSIPGANGKYLFLRGQFIPFEIAEHLNMDEAEVWNILNDQPQSENIESLSASNQASWIETNLFMQNQLLRDGDVMSMAHGIEIRVPFLDGEFMALTHSLKSDVKFSGKRPKQLLIDAFKDVLPEPIWNRPKMGFGLPFKKWLAEDEYIKSILPPDSPEFKKFASGSMHWSQFLSLVLIQNSQTGNNASNGQKPFSFELTHKNPEQPIRGISERSSGKDILFLTLRTFSGTGGIEKVSKIAGKALHDLYGEKGGNLSVWSMYDEQKDIDEKYFPEKNFRGFGIHKLAFMAKCIAKGRKSAVVILSHINLLPVGYFIKKASPKTRLILITHGIEVWEPLTGRQKFMLQKCDDILCVSAFTRNKLMTVNHVPEKKLQVLNNCLDPYLREPVDGEKDASLLKAYGFAKDDIILMTLTRLAGTERYKGYDKVLESFPRLLKEHPGLKYLIIGKYDQAEKSRLDGMIKDLNLESYVTFAGFVADEALAAHFNLADIYIMPSEKEGFGIVFIEAMFYQKPVIAGNKDGSVDALLNGELGLLVDPASLSEITAAITRIIKNKEAYIPDRNLLMEHFSYEKYMAKWEAILDGPSGFEGLNALTESNNRNASSGLNLS